MRSTLAALLLTTVIGSAVGLTPSPVSSAVPDKPFTITQCEGYSDSVARLYLAGLAREPEQGGFDFWITEYTLGRWSFPRMAEFFVESDEFQSSYGSLTQDEFIRQLYRNVLGREGEPGGVTFWNEQMAAGMTRATVLMRFAESPENIANSGTAAPILGPFNEGRSEGYWRCGPSLADTLFSIDDFGEDWSQDLDPARAIVGPGCESALRMPDDIDQVQFEFASGPSILQGSYIAPTPYGAELVMAQMRRALVDCGSFDSAEGYSETISEMSFPRFGDDSIALRMSRTYPDLRPIEYDRVIIRTGVVITAVQNYDIVGVDSELTEAYASLAAERVAALPFTG